MNLILFLIVNVVFCYMATVGFGVILNIPRRGLNACGIVGVIGWLGPACTVRPGISCRALFCDWKKRFGFELSCSSWDDCRFDCGRFLFGRVRIPGLF